MSRFVASPIPMIKLEDFSGSVFKSWKRNTQLGMKYLNIFYTVLTDFASCGEDVDHVQWISDEDFCRDYLLNCLSDHLAEMYSKMKTAKEIWDGLEEQFKQENNLSKTHLIRKFMAFTFDEDRAILPQVTDLENIIDKLHYENIFLPDEFVVGAIIYKLPSTWYVFKIEMYWKNVQVGLVDLKHFIRIEDENRTRHALEIDSKEKYVANIVTNPKHPPKFGKTKPVTSAPAVADTSKKIKKFKGKCYNCNKWGHCAFECKQPKREKSDTERNNRANMISQTELSNFVPET